MVGEPSDVKQLSLNHVCKIGLTSLMKIAGSGSGVGSVSQRYKSADPDPYRNVTDPQHSETITLLVHLGISV